MLSTAHTIGLLLALAARALATEPSPLDLCHHVLTRHGAPRLNYDFIVYLAMRNRGELRSMPRGALYYLEKTYLYGWDVTPEAMLDEHIPFLRFRPAGLVERELHRDTQLVIESFRSRR